MTTELLTSPQLATILLKSSMEERARSLTKLEISPTKGPFSIHS